MINRLLFLKHVRRPPILHQNGAEHEGNQGGVQGEGEGERQEGVELIC